MENQTQQQMQEAKYLKAKNRIEELKKFYKHVMVYLIVNIIITSIKVYNYMDRGDTLLEALSEFDSYVVWLIWGFFLLLQAFKTYQFSLFLGKDWEERKIKEFMNEK